MRLLILATAAALVTACAPKLAITRYRPSEVNLQPARQLSLEVKSRETSTVEDVVDLALLFTGSRIDPKLPLETLRSTLSQSLTANGFYTLASEPSAADVAFKVLITQWNESEEENKDSGTYSLNAGLGVNVDVYRGEQQIFTRAYRAYPEVTAADGTELARAREELLRIAAEQIASQLTADVTPVAYRDDVPLENEGPVKHAVSLIRDEKYEEARAELNAVLEKDASSAPAHYNLGVLDEAKGSLQEARTHYLRAKELKPSPLYSDALARLERVEAECRAINCAAR